MIGAGLVLLAIGAADLVREFVPAARRWIGLLVAAVALVLLGILSGAVVETVIALAVAAGWVWLTPVGRPARAGFWPPVLVGAVCAAFVVAVPPRADAGIIGTAWSLPTPFGVLSFDHVVLVVGAVLFLLESTNIVVRTALTHQRVQVAAVPDDSTPTVAPDSSRDSIAERADAVAPPAVAPVVVAPTDEPAPIAAEPALKGGRLIGPLERLLVFTLTLAAIYPLLAAILAAKGIVRFPEISRDSGAGNRAEYFLIGSLVSWSAALAAAFLVWWAFATPVVP